MVDAAFAVAVAVLCIGFWTVAGWIVELFGWATDRWAFRDRDRKRREWLETSEGMRLRSVMRVARVRYFRALIKAGR